MLGMLLVWSAFIACVGTSTAADIGCPPDHNGRPLQSVRFFDGPPAERVELVPEPGRFVITEGDTPSSHSASSGIIQQFDADDTARGLAAILATIETPGSLRMSLGTGRWIPPCGR